MNSSRVIARWVSDGAGAWNETAMLGARRAFHDTVACMLAGSGETAPMNVHACVVGWGAGECTIVGTASRLSAPWAALVNGTAAHALDFDDVLEIGAAHASAVLVPALLALGEEHDVSVDACLDAYLTGLEVLARLSEAVNMAHYYRGWHTTLTLGAPAVAAACSRLLQLDEKRTLAAISLATSSSSGFKRQFGTMAKPVHAGLAAKNGLMAAGMAAAGVTADEEVFEGPGGFLPLFAGTEISRLERSVARIGEPSAMEQYGMWQKLYPCCASLHRPVDALLELRTEHGLRPDDVACIEAVVSEIAVQNLAFHRPANAMQARFCLPYTLASVLIDGQLTLDAFTSQAIEREKVDALVSVITMQADAKQAGTAIAGKERERATVNISLKDGTTLSRVAVDPRGHPRNPLTARDGDKKFHDCASRSLSAEASMRALACLNGLDSISDIRALTDALRPKGERPDA
jgi:2-methylcitrate dehydratase PrpD